jgi:hypothetical protein
MSLTKEDLQQIKEVVIEVVDERVEPRFTAMDIAIQTLTTSTANQFGNIVRQLDGIYDELAVIKDDVAVVKDYVKDHGFRIAKLERRPSS